MPNQTVSLASLPYNEVKQTEQTT